MKKTVSFIVAFTFIALTNANVFAQTLQGKKVGFLDLSNVFDNYEKTKEFDSVLEGKHKDYETFRNTKLEKLRETQAKLALLKEEEKTKVQEEIDGMRAEILDYDRQKRTDLTKERDERIREVLLEIEKVVSDYAKKENFAFVLNDRVLIYGNEVYNISEPILKILNENFQKKK